MKNKIASHLKMAGRESPLSVNFILLVAEEGCGGRRNTYRYKKLYTESRSSRR